MRVDWVVRSNGLLGTLLNRLEELCEASTVGGVFCRKKTLRDAAEDCADALIANERVPYLTPEQDAALAEIETAFLERIR